VNISFKYGRGCKLLYLSQRGVRNSTRALNESALNRTSGNKNKLYKIG
jgi:hypothetical protein